MPSLTRGSLPARVYWRRRAFVALLAATLLFVVVSVMRGGSDGSDGAPVATQAGAEVAPSGESSADSSGPLEGEKKQQRPLAPVQGPTFDPSVLSDPEGECADDDVQVMPRVERAVAGRDVTLFLDVRTRTAEACTWRVSARNLTLKITSGPDDIWSTRECPKAISPRDLVVRRVAATELKLTWNARRSDAGCPAATQWALPGFYYVDVAALGGEPADVQFKLERPKREVVEPGPNPDSGNKSRGDRAGQRDQPRENDPRRRPHDRGTDRGGAPGSDPSGAVEPDQT